MRHPLLAALMALIAALSLSLPRACAASDAQGAGATAVKLKTKDGQEKVINLADKKQVDVLIHNIKAAQVADIEHAILEQTKAPSRNLMELRWDTALWTIVVFVLLLLILKKAAWGPMLEGLKKREESIQAALVEAKEAREEAAKLKDELQRERGLAAEKVREMLEEARKDADHTRNEMLAKAKAEIQTERDRLLRELGTARDQALQEIWNQGAQLASLISTKAIRRNLGADDHRRLVDEALVELKQATRGKTLV